MPGSPPPASVSNKPVKVAKKEIHWIENKRKSQDSQEAQGPFSYWAWQEGNFTLPTPKQKVKEHKGGMCSSGLALHHPASELLLQYATQGCPTNTG